MSSTARVPSVLTSLVLLTFSSSVRLYAFAGTVFFFSVSLCASSCSFPGVSTAYFTTTSLSFASANLRRAMCFMVLATVSFVFLSCVIPLLNSVNVSLIY